MRFNRIEMKKVLIDMLGQKCGRLTVISRAENKDKRAYWNCLCECGNIKIVEGKRLRTGHTQSCGCIRKETISKQGINNRHNEEYIKQKLLEKGFELLSPYQGILKSAKHRCLKCNHIFIRQIQSSLYHTSGCRNCYIQTQGGWVCSNYFKNKPEMKDVPCKVYLLKFSGNDEEFYKIGITRQRLSERTRKIPYDLIESKVIETTFYEAYKIEKELKLKIKPQKYRPKIKFDGCGECFKT